jgi:hypothetical protein
MRIPICIDAVTDRICGDECPFLNRVDEQCDMFKERIKYDPRWGEDNRWYRCRTCRLVTGEEEGESL